MNDNDDRLRRNTRKMSTDDRLDTRPLPSVKPKRRAVVLRRNGKPDWGEVEAYLPRNYQVLGETPGAVLIEGTDNAGWTLDDYVIPRLASGLITAREIDASQRLLHEIHDEIVKDWKRPHYAALPYLQAMRYLGVKWDSYGDQDGESVIRYFLNNASTWRGETARRVKAELRELLGDDAQKGGGLNA